MHLKDFLSNPFNKHNFIEFISERFYGFAPKLNSDEYLGKVKLDDKNEIGFFIFKVDENKDIENTRVGFHSELKKYADKYSLDGAIGAFYHPLQKAWRLSYIEFSYDDKHKQQATHQKRFTYLLGINAVNTPFSQFEKIQKYTTITQVKESFSVERVSKEFFEAYKNLFETLNQHLLPQLSLFEYENHLHAFSKKLLGRIVFLYFLQKKGWLGVKKDWGDGDKNFLSNLYKKDKNDFYFKKILPLFFDTLNKKRNDNFSDIFNSKIPFLNGGLFDKSSIDDKIFLEDTFFGDIFALFDRYNFTIIEDSADESEVAIDPEMLGRVFENLLEENYRKGKGAFYTPREIVGYMCKSSIEEYLKDKNDKLQAIKKIKVLDPAIGSGAFPMGMLHEIVQTRVHLGDKTPYAKLKREIIENSIYGVDIDGDAVEIAKLRFWLSLTVDETVPSPLPNLDFKIMQGNSLLETINGFDIIPTDIYEKIVRKQTDLFGGFEEQTLFARTLYEELSEKIHKFYNDTSGVDKKSHKEEIKSLVRQIIEEYLMREEQQYKHHEKNIVSFNSKKKKLADDMSKTLDNILIAQRVLDEILSNNFQSKELFLYKLWFGEVMQDGGFDVVIGNPPYIRQEKIKELKPKLQIEGYKSYNGTADIYVYFFEQGYRLLKEGGNLSFITSNKYTRAKYGKEFRDFVLKNTDILEYIDFNGVKVFESATVDTSILSFRKRADNMMVGVVPRGYPNENDTGQPQGIAPTFLYCDVKSDYKGEDLSDYCQKNGFLYAQNDLTLDSFSFANPAELKIKKKIELIGTSLKEWDIKINYGIKTGFNEAFIISQEKRDELVGLDPKSAEIIKPMLRGRDIKRYGYEFAGLYLINSHNNPPININNYPAIKEHLDKYLPQLEKRQDKGATPYNLRNCAYLEEFEKEKIVYSEIVREAQFYLDGGDFIVEATGFILSGKKLRFLIALLNSKFVTYIFRKFYMGTELGATGIRYKKAFVEQLPIPKILQEEQQPFIDLVDKIMELKAKNEETKELENQIDRKVYELYGLSEDEIKVVEGRE